MTYGDKRDYPKIAVFFVCDLRSPGRSQTYMFSTTWSRTCKEARVRAAKKLGVSIECIRAHTHKGSGWKP